ncbi:MAG: hypothetical protein DME26_18260 [Verrucomicrobia bacterium]|nr:MAG: hypothetical protein DME26_18260 [Verrucomicrobiota bacterium]
MAALVNEKKIIFGWAPETAKDAARVLSRKKFLVNVAAGIVCICTQADLPAHGPDACAIRRAGSTGSLAT